MHFHENAIICSQLNVWNSARKLEWASNATSLHLLRKVRINNFRVIQAGAQIR